MLKSVNHAVSVPEVAAWAAIWLYGLLLWGTL